MCDRNVFLFFIGMMRKLLMKIGNKKKQVSFQITMTTMIQQVARLTKKMTKKDEGEKELAFNED